MFLTAFLQQGAGRAEAYERILQLWWDQMDAGMQRVYLRCTFYVPIPAAVRLHHSTTVTAAAAVNAAAATATAAAAVTAAVAAATTTTVPTAVTIVAEPPPPAKNEKHGHGLRFPGSVARSV